MSDGSGPVTVEPRRRWPLFVAGGCVVFVAVVIGVAVWGGASSNEDCSANVDGEGQPMCTLSDYLETSSIVLRGTLSPTPIDDASMLPVGTLAPGATANANDTQPEDVAWHSFTPTQILYADPRLEHRGQQIPTAGSAMPFGLPHESSRQLSGSTGDGVADVVVFGTWLGTDLIAGYHVVGPPAGILAASSSAAETDQAPFINARLIASGDDMWLAEIGDLSSARTAVLGDELEECLTATDMAVQSCG